MSDFVSAISMPRKPTVYERTEVKIQRCAVVLQVRWVEFLKQRLSFMIYIYIYREILVPAVVIEPNIFHMSLISFIFFDQFFLSVIETLEFQTLVLLKKI